MSGDQGSVWVSGVPLIAELFDLRLDALLGLLVLKLRVHLVVASVDVARGEC